VVGAFEQLTGRRPTVIVEAVGIPGMIQKCIDMAEKDSRIVVVGVCMSSDSFEPSACILKSLQLIFTFGYTTADYAYILQLLEAGRITARPLISHRIGLDELPGVFEQMRKPSDQIKVMVCPNPGND
jgi:(R,R)-butanediol dehydrogenase/meso-butanediol dehydrogenase/diacetyl reductase